MATPADQRLLELVDKWLKSLELHIRYSGLDSDSYWKIQPWPEHQRPSRWIIDLALQKALALRTQVQERIKMSDTKFSDSLELMTFLANLIGSEHIERFIPLADPDNERSLKSAPPDTEPESAPDAATGTREMPGLVPDDRRATLPATAPPISAAPLRAPAKPAPPQAAAPPPPPAPPPSKPPAAKAAPDSASGTREMPEFVAAKRRGPPPIGTDHVARTERRTGAAKPPPKNPPKQAAKLERSDDAAREQVVADAARLVQWGRKWYELAELIARMADRPPLPEVRRILKDNKTAIEKKAGGS